jgi:signal transduction histidine kinase
LFDEQGFPVGFLGADRDITERKNSERNRKKEASVNAAKGFAGGISHDFNNIFQGISSNIEVAKKKISKNQDPQKELENVEQGIARAAKLIQQLSMFANDSNPHGEIDSIRKKYSKFS